MQQKHQFESLRLLAGLIYRLAGFESCI